MVLSLPAANRFAFIRFLWLATALAGSFGMAAPALADDEPAPSLDETTLTGDWGGLRTTLSNYGVDVSGTEILDVQGNPTGGTTPGGIAVGALEPGLDVDFGKLAGVDGLTAHVTAFQIHGRGLSASDLNGNLAAASGIEAERDTRLFEAWAQQQFYGGDLSVRIGEIAADQEFVVSQYGLLFVNSTYGWPGSLAADMTSGGPAYPLATPGVRVKIGQNEPWSLQAAVLDGDPSGGPGVGSAQSRDPSGTNFPLGHGALLMSELAYAHKGAAVDLPGTYKLGAWYNTENFKDLRTGTDGLSLADPASNGIARKHSGNYGFYGVVDQMLWHPEGSSDNGLAGFARILWNPDDRNLVAYQLDAGFNLIGMVPGRDKDIIGLGFSYLPISSKATGLDRDANFFNGTNAPVRHYESQMELTYQAPINYWLTLQPDFQYIFHPGGNVANPQDISGTKPVGDAAIIGLRAIIKF